MLEQMGQVVITCLLIVVVSSSNIVVVNCSSRIAVERFKGALPAQ
jgi:regulator of protease activity HflC (stomatin/prohibitin superfamily)